MDSEFFLMMLKIIVFLPFLLLLIYISLKYGGSKLQSIQNGRYIKVIDRAALTKENSLLIVKIGDKGHVVSSSNGKVELLMEISREELQKIEESKAIPEYANFKEFIAIFNTRRKDKNEKNK